MHTQGRSVEIVSVLTETKIGVTISTLTCNSIQQPVFGSKHSRWPDNGSVRVHLTNRLLALEFGLVETGLGSWVGVEMGDVNETWDFKVGSDGGD